MSKSESLDWDVEQLEVILEEPKTWQLVEAGPGAGKSAVACQRIAYLVDEGVPAQRMLLISFTRTAIAELRDRIVKYAIAGERAKSVRLSTIDSHAWTLRSGFDDKDFPIGSDNPFELNIDRTIELFRSRQPDLMEFMSRLEHLIVDEAQDVMGSRADLILEILRGLSPDCGVTLLADPSQAIYGFTTDVEQSDGAASSLLERLSAESPRPFVTRRLIQNHRIKSLDLGDLFLKARKAIEQATPPEGHVEHVRNVIRETCGDDVGVSTYKNIPSLLKQIVIDPILVLFRWRADVLVASSYCSGESFSHRLRMSSLPVVVKPWLGWLFGSVENDIVTHAEYDALWTERATACEAPFREVAKDESWALLHRLAAGRLPNTIDMVQLRNLLSRPKPPVEFCYSDLGTRGPTLGTIHASKGREADTVVLVLPSRTRASDSNSDASVLEEGRVYYVGATRARRALIVAETNPTKASTLKSGRVYRFVGGNKVQLEIGRAGDIDNLAHLGWEDRMVVQARLAATCGKEASVYSRTDADEGYVRKLIVKEASDDGITRLFSIGQLSQSFDYDMKKLWSVVDKNNNLRPPTTIPHLYLIGVTTVGVSEDERSAVKAPFRRSRLALAPVIKGLPMINFEYRRHARGN